jgi:hypothetical protein
MVIPSPSSFRVPKADITCAEFLVGHLGTRPYRKPTCFDRLAVCGYLAQTSGERRMVFRPSDTAYRYRLGLCSKGAQLAAEGLDDVQLYQPA